MLKNWYVYQILNKDDKIVYVGVDGDINNIFVTHYRQKQMPSSLRRHITTKKNMDLRNFLRKKEWKWEVVLTCFSKKEAHQEEAILIDEFAPRYNNYLKKRGKVFNV